ncbi:MAG TPA: DnaJ domain-containing protein [Oligoflexia bacterium]|nr:DnaJ domain-containing protein [Oligoflexia bacterium]HMP49127.1 DnaJ domain-containing protein [Oligoflexia bacterium]
MAILTLPFTLMILIICRIYEAATKTRSYQSKDKYDYSYRHQKVEPEDQPSQGKDLYEILGVRYNASREEIRAAFKNKMMMNHPDKLAALDPELQRIATQRTIAIKDAYERLFNKAG